MAEAVSGDSDGDVDVVEIAAPKPTKDDAATSPATPNTFAQVRLILQKYTM